MDNQKHFLDTYLLDLLPESHIIPSETKMSDKRYHCYPTYDSLIKHQVRDHIQHQITEYINMYSKADPDILSYILEVHLSNIMDEIIPFVRITEKPFVNKGNIYVKYHIDYQGTSQAVKTIISNLNLIYCLPELNK